MRRAGLTSSTESGTSNLPSVKGDRIQLQQVILNLVLNAADAMGEVRDTPRELRIETASHAFREICLSARDSGLFQTFHSSKSNGMGIGLSVSRSIIENHGGRLWAMPNDGPGATFSFLIPPQPTP